MSARIRLPALLVAALCAGALLAPPALALPTAARARAAGPPAAAPIHRLGHAHTAGRSTVSTSTNWAGYSVSGAAYSSVTATWTQPTVAPGTSFGGQFVAFWVGLDGDGSSTVEQIGTSALVFGGFIQYYAWWEMYPDPSVMIPSMSVHPGDAFTATVTGNGGGSFTLTLRNVTTGKAFTTTQSDATALQTSAEIVAEAPSAADGSQLELADFGSVTFSGCAIGGQPLSALPWDQITMASESGDTLATTGPLSADGSSFAVSVGGSGTTDTSPPITTVSGGDALWHAAPVTLTFSASDGTGSGVTYTEFSVDGGVFTRGASVTIPAPADHSHDGTHTVRYRSADNAGNVETLKTQTVKVDTLGPVASAQNASVRRGGFVTLRYAVRDALSPQVASRLTLTSGAGAVVKDWSWGYRTPPPGNSMWSKRFRCTLPAGAYVIGVTGKDLASNAQSVTGSATLLVR